MIIEDQDILQDHQEILGIEAEKEAGKEIEIDQEMIMDQRNIETDQDQNQDRDQDQDQGQEINLMIT